MNFEKKSFFNILKLIIFKGNQFYFEYINN